MNGQEVVVIQDDFEAAADRETQPSCVPPKPDMFFNPGRLRRDDSFFRAEELSNDARSRGAIRTFVMSCDMD